MNYYFYEFCEKLKSDSRFNSLNGKLIETRRKIYKNGMELEEKELLIIFRIKPNKCSFEKTLSFSLIHIIETKETSLIIHVKGNVFKYTDINYKDITKTLYNEIYKILEPTSVKIAQ